MYKIIRFYTIIITYIHHKKKAILRPSHNATKQVKLINDITRITKNLSKRKVVSKFKIKLMKLKNSLNRKSTLLI